MDDTRDFLDELIAEGAAEDPSFAARVDAAVRRREFLRALGRLRDARGLSQQTIAERMRTRQPAVARLERGESDPKLSTLERYAAALGLELDLRLVAPVTPPDRLVEGGAARGEGARGAQPQLQR